MKKYIYFLIITYLSLSGCGFHGDPAEKTVVTVGTKEITVGDLTREIKRLASQMGISNQRAKEMLEPLVNQIVDRYLILEYGREKGIIITEEDLKRAVTDLEADYQDQDLQEILLHGFIDYEEWTAELRQRLLIKKIVAKVSEGIKPVSTEEIKQYFEAHHNEFRRPYMVEFRQIVTASEEEAQELLKKLNGGGDMEQLAREYSIAPEAENGGEVGWVAKGELEEDMEEAIFSLPVGKISGVVRTNYGFHIFEVLSKRPEGFMSLPEAMTEIESKLLYEKKTQFYNKWLQGLRTIFPVKINKELLKTLDLE